MSKKRKKIGLPPGSIVYTGKKNDKKINIDYVQYFERFLEEQSYDNHHNIIFQRSQEDKVDWYDIRGIHDTELIEQIGLAFDIHPLILEDITDINQRPKFEEYEKGIFIVLRALSFNKSKLEIATEQVAFYFKEGFAVSFQETESDLFALVRKRIQNSKGKIRSKGSDYLVYALIDVIVDNYFLVFEDIEDEIEKLEESILLTQDSKIKSSIHHLKRELVVMRKSIAPLREAIARFSKTESDFVNEGTEIYIRNVYEHTIHIMDTLESYRDILNGLQDLFISEVSFKMNQVMQVLTIVSTIFIPLTFLAGIYGMNFEYIPELKWHYSYFVFWIVLIIIFISLLGFFKKKKWF